MHKIVGVKFHNSNRVYYFYNDSFDIKINDEVIVETGKGLQLGVVTKFFDNDLSTGQFKSSLKRVLRIANKDDLMKNEKNLNECKNVLRDARSTADDLNLNMNFVNASFTFDRKQLMINFISDKRVDFREFVKRMASIYHTRIELRQLGVRDKTREIGGIGLCGRLLCCNTFLNEFSTLSISMAKNQYLAINPAKINGVCGRLLCCLDYEDSQYIEMKKGFPPIGTIINKGKTSGKVSSHNLFNRTYTLTDKNGKIIEVVKVDESN